MGSSSGTPGAVSGLKIEADESHVTHALRGPTAYCPLWLVQRQWFSAVEFQNNPPSLDQMPLSRKPGPISSLSRTITANISRSTVCQAWGWVPFKYVSINAVGWGRLLVFLALEAGGTQ